jgi:hypothetical protein
MRIRIFLFLTFLFVLAAGPASAENRFVVFGGLNIATQVGDMDEIGDMLASIPAEIVGGDWSSAKGSITGFGGGVGFLVATSPTFGVQIEAQYVRRGSKFDIQGRNISEVGFPSSIDMVGKFKLDYLELPFLFRYSPSPEAKFRPVFLAGPSVGMNLSANFEVENGGSSQSQDSGAGYADGSLGLIGGLGLDALVGETTHLIFQARYYLGLTNVLNDPDLEAKSSDLSFSIGIEVPLKSGSGDEKEGP